MQGNEVYDKLKAGAVITVIYVTDINHPQVYVNNRWMGSDVATEYPEFHSQLEALAKAEMLRAENVAPYTQTLHLRDTAK